ncbi:MAG TPA: M60 family metallopeptidase [Polyangiaceae bacterium]|nr:M60 family metallopeptidase [Polyangiaceae bacterium]
MKLTALSLVLLLGSAAACSGEALDADGLGGAGEDGASGGAGTGGAASGGAASGGASSGGSTGGSGEPLDPCAAAEDWTCVAVPPVGEYGTRTIEVPARQNWVNTGLYLKEGESATLTASGSWTVTNTGETIHHGSCLIGDMVARIGLHYEEEELTCITGSGETQVVADKDGILFVGALPSTDLGETYETRHDDSGVRTVVVSSSEGELSPTVAGSAAGDYPWEQVLAGAVEVWGEHVILTLPTEVAQADAATLQAAVAKLDEIYGYERELRGAQPHGGQRLRFFPDGTNPGYMLAGNPIRMQLDLVEGDDSTRISRAGETGASLWGFAHEMGHDFSFAPNGFWAYQEATLESWCNLFSIYAFEKLGLELHEATLDCSASSTGSYQGGSWDAWEGLCFLRQFQFEYGWDFYDAYFQSILSTTSYGAGAWPFVKARFDAAAGEDTAYLFDEWGVPY